MKTLKTCDFDYVGLVDKKDFESPTKIWFRLGTPYLSMLKYMVTRPNGFLLVFIAFKQLVMVNKVFRLSQELRPPRSTYFWTVRNQESPDFGTRVTVTGFTRALSIALDHASNHLWEKQDRQLSKWYFIVSCVFFSVILMDTILGTNWINQPWMSLFSMAYLFYTCALSCYSWFARNSSKALYRS